MKVNRIILYPLLFGVAITVTSGWTVAHKADVATEIKAPAPVKRYLYVAVPGIRDYLGYGGHGILVFDINNNHQFVKRIKTQGLHPNGKPSNVKGIAVSVPLNSIFVSTLESLQRIDLATDK